MMVSSKPLPPPSPATRHTLERIETKHISRFSIYSYDVFYHHRVFIFSCMAASVVLCQQHHIDFAFSLPSKYLQVEAHFVSENPCHCHSFSLSFLLSTLVITAIGGNCSNDAITSNTRLPEEIASGDASDASVSTGISVYLCNVYFTDTSTLCPRCVRQYKLSPLCMSVSVLDSSNCAAMKKKRKKNASFDNT